MIVELLRVGGSRKLIGSALKKFAHGAQPALRPILQVLSWEEEALGAYATLFDRYNQVDIYIHVQPYTLPVLFSATLLNK